MSVIGSYFRLKAADLDRALREPGWAREFMREQAVDEPRRSPSERRFHDTEKSWAALAHLLALRGLPSEIVHGDRPLPGDEDWGYGPPRTLTSDQVAAAAGQLADVRFADLAADVTPADLAAAEVYPTGLWSDPYALDYVGAHYGELLAYLTRTARYRHGLLVWYS
ncbi:YfbM family protein [Kitasatospora sp. NPDC049285]|uniref:YfbM family protein n=1 Tax=Kitasatospora sp. NPDC049285 TaxID=3157096 RepID=UPI003431F19C